MTVRGTGTVPARTIADLQRAGLLDPELARELDAVASRYAVTVTPAMLSLIDPADPDDPIARQFLPSRAELTASADDLTDPIGDARHSPVDGIVHRYPDRVLLKLLHVCPVYCRFCFRREMVGPGGESLSPDELETALDYVRQRPEIWEVILTGGDPLLLSPRRMAALMSALDAIGHLGVIRLHSRVPVAEPERIDEPLLAALRTRDKAVWLAVHANHPRELTAAALDSLRRLAEAGIALVSQTVLLKGVNDDPQTLEALFRALVKARVKPYYLHHADLAPGTAHFRTTLGEGQTLMRSLRGRVSGLCLPTYVLDVPGGHGKVPVGPCHLSGAEETGWQVEDVAGRSHPYPPRPQD